MGERGEGTIPPMVNITHTGIVPAPMHAEDGQLSCTRVRAQLKRCGDGAVINGAEKRQRTSDMHRYCRGLTTHCSS